MKFKTPQKEYFKIALDRLTRLKEPSYKYLRFVEDIISKHLISHDTKIAELSFDEKAELACRIFNFSFSSCDDLFEVFSQDEKRTYHLKDEEVFLNHKLNFRGALDLFSPQELPLNLLRYKLYDKDEDTREKYSLLYPVSKIILTEGITEEILLIEFAHALNLDFKKEGFYVLGAGGKNQVARKYYKMIEDIKIPVFILLDSDAVETYEIIKPKLRECDYLYKIKSGEFEDIMPKNLIKNALNKHFEQNILTDDPVFDEGSTVSGLNNFYKNNGWGEFKKADFAKIVREYLKSTNNPPITGELKDIIDRIKSI